MHSFREYLYFLWKKASEKQSRKKYEGHFHDDIERFNQCKERKPKGQIDREMRVLAKYWGCYPYQYYRYDFYRRDCQVTVSEMKDYIPNFFMYSLFFPRSFMDYGILCEHKGITYPFLAGNKIPQPRMLFRWDDQKFYDEFNTPVSPARIDELISQSTAAKIFVKPSFGLGGKGIMVFGRKGENAFADEAGDKLTAAYFRDTVRDGFYVVQEGVLQNSEMSGLYPHSVNTFRIVTECIKGESRIVYSLIRMGRGGKQVDNASSGGLYIKIDPASGILHDYAFSHNRIKFDVHPDTGFIFNNAKIKHWEEVKDFILLVSKKFREIKYLGWDVAISEEGPLIIEINNGPDIELIQDFYGGIRQDMHVEPLSWWYNSKYTLKDL